MNALGSAALRAFAVAWYSSQVVGTVSLYFSNTSVR